MMLDRCYGRVTWSGKQFVKAVGERAANLAPEAASTLIEEFGTSGSWSLCGSYARVCEHRTGLVPGAQPHC
jgi:hypothetical protein